jgi:hypothetical protein
VTEIEAALHRRLLVGLRNATKNVLAEQADVAGEGEIGLGGRRWRLGERAPSGHRG